MSRNRIALAATAASACAALLFVAQPATAAPQAATPQAAGPYGCVPQGQTGLYLSKEGEATLTYSTEFVSALRKQNIRTEAVAPNSLKSDGRSMLIPIGEKYDNIELPSGRVCYPGGMKWTNPATDATYEVDDFWIKFEAIGNSKVFTTPNINGTPRAGGELNLANFTVAQALTTGQFMPHNGGIGPKRVTFTIDAEFAQDLNRTLGTDLKAGDPWATLDIAWKGIPTRALPSFNTPELAGLGRMSEALNAAQSLPNPFGSFPQQ